MSRFPTYEGQLPEYLNPLNPGHYLLLAYWVYFRPTALKYYLYRSDPNLYYYGLSVISTLHRRAYRNLYLMMPGTVLLLSALGGLLFALVTAQQTTINWLGLAGAAAITLAIAFGYSLLGSFAIGVAGGVAGGIAFGVAVGVATIALLVSGIELGIELTVEVGAAIAHTTGLAFGVGFSAVAGVTEGLTFGMAFGWAIGAWFLLTGKVAIAIAVIIASSVGASGVIFYPFELLVAFCSALGFFRNRGPTHPVEWNELLVLPLPGTRQALLRRLQRDAESGLAIVAEVARNPFQRWAPRQALHNYLHEHSAPLYFLYELLRAPMLDEYTFAPVNPGDWEVLPTTRQLLLGELDRQSLDLSTDPTRLADNRVLVPIGRWRDRRHTSLTRFAGMLARLLPEGTVDAKDFDLSKYQTTYEGLTDYSGGVEISQSFAALTAFLAYDHLDNIPAAVDVIETLPEIPLDTAVRPTVLTALERLKEVGADVATYQAATSQRNKLAALALASDSLDCLEEYVTAEVVAPEQTILQRIIRQWRRLASDAQGKLARIQVLSRVDNPYVAGNPVTGKLFVGREDILQQLQQSWGKSKQCDSVVLYGHRRMGKTSILQNLGAYFSDRTIIIDFNMQRIGRVENTGKLLFYLAEKMYDAWIERTQTDIGKLNQEEFLNDPYRTFDRFLQRLHLVIDGDRFIVTVDEFESIDLQIDQGRIDPFLLENWRGTFQTYPWFIMAFAGLHNLEEMRRNYWNPLYSSVRAIRVSFLPRPAAIRLITQPTDDFPLDYDSDAVEQIIQLTNGQPYLVQLICDNLVTRFNRQIVYEGIKRDSRLTVEDVEAVINSTEFYEDGGSYFEGVWSQAKDSQQTGQLEILKALTDTSLSLTELAERTGFSPEEIQYALETLQRHDVIEQRDEQYIYTVELMGRWVRERKMGDAV
ncbi:MAG: hypothetical protein AB4352_06850 [Hormoscilla sp.]